VRWEPSLETFDTVILTKLLLYFLTSWSDTFLWSPVKKLILCFLF